MTCNFSLKTAARTLCGCRPILVAAATTAALAGCGDVLEVENPNDVLQESIEQPEAANAVVNGALATTAISLSNAVRGSVAVTDEYDWVASWNAAGQLDRGYLDLNSNDFTNTLFNDLATSRWMSDEAIRLLEGFAAEGTLPSRLGLGRAYLYSGINYVTIADLFENFAFSDQQEVAPPVGPESMGQVYDTALGRFNEAIEVARSIEDADLELRATAMLARAHWAKALWGKLNPPGSVPAEPLIDDAAANEAARAALAMVPEPDWKFQFQYSSSTVGNVAASWFNSRLEMVVGHVYARIDESGKKICSPFNPQCPEDGIILEDPIDSIPDPALKGIVYGFIEGYVYPPITIVSARELHLILAEAALEQGDIGTFAEQINVVRALNGLTPYDPAVHDITPLELLIHERRVNLFLQAQRRLADLYRFGIEVAEWAEDSDARNAPGTVFPIGEEERLSNCYILGTC